MSNYRWGGYLLVALGLLNLRYQTGEAGVFLHSAIIAIPGVIILALSFIPKTAQILEREQVKKIAIILGIATIVYAALN
ncbi:MAG: hypothetical protein HQ476_03120 [SAR202 cluster bacterium]|jgi:hypothetical protein|nr:hypothetical protein [SAR202 cluster bacterium]